jgi:dihydropteroate synthase
VAHGVQLLEEGADILDLGAESTRPGSPGATEDALTAVEEQARLLPVLDGILKARPDALISVDTYKAATARAAIEAGAEIINDVSGLTWDQQMAATCAGLLCGLVLTHTRGKPSEWRTQPPLASDEILPLVRDGLQSVLERADASCIARESILLDPGYGFGKRFDENYALLTQQSELLALGRPILAGLSRKSFLTRSISGTNTPAALSREQEIAAREVVGVAAMVAAILHGASIVRVHEVLGARHAAAIADLVLSSSATD